MTDRQVVPNFKSASNYGPCQCGRDDCGEYGRLGKAWADGTRCLLKGCPCKRCMGRHSKKTGRVSQAKTATKLGVPTSTLRPGHEENFRGPVRWEHKSGDYAKPVLTKFLASEVQSEAARARGDLRPFVATFEYEGRTVAVADLNDLAEVTAALVDGLGMAR